MPPRPPPSDLVGVQNTPIIADNTILKSGNKPTLENKVALTVHVNAEEPIHSAETFDDKLICLIKGTT